MGADALKFLDIVNGFMASAFFVYFVLSLSVKPRFKDNMLNMGWGMIIYQAGGLFVLFIVPLLDDMVNLPLSVPVGMAFLFAAVCFLSKDSLARKIFILLMYVVPIIIINVCIRLIITQFAGISGENIYVSGLSSIYAITCGIVYCMCVVLFVNRDSVRSVILPMVLMMCFPILGLIDLVFALSAAPDKISIVNCIGGSLQLYITVTVAILMSRFMKRNKHLIMQERERAGIEKIRDIDRQYYDEVQRDVDYVRKFRHDITNYIEQIEYLIDHPDDKSNETVRDMVKELKVRTSKTSTQRYCEDPFVNMILTLKTDKCKKLGIPFHIKANLPDCSSIDPLDKSSVLSNIIDNAINESIRCKEAGEDADVSVSIGTMGDYVAIRVENNTLVDQEIHSIDELMKRKRASYDRSEHGYGLVILKEKVAKYDGNIILDIKDNKCVLIASVKTRGTGEVTANV